MMPIVDGLEIEFASQITFYRFNALEDDNAALQSQLGLRGHPAMAILDRDGEIVTSFVGPQSTDALRQALTAVLND